ncbi:diaminopropionate ammonia-lyase [Iocasia frigidifontis]|uniref:Diaminopropionate ammonia-lyase n=1 Tax=Iocasia fonsfrigidae TaxID=2682810 RepID=A0A8A7KF40_9FIRM|nr:diaminopropionate ammonia-lyase [Iocasia fonsfrigidae]QTL97517.1 diaminopropionate ammonia-lyase [Iocasia fonsfrigidae]
MSNIGDLKIIYNKNKDNKALEELEYFSGDIIKEVRNFHNSFSEYKITPLHDLQALAREYNVNKIWIKDESYRFGLNAFKVLGGSYAIAKYLSKITGTGKLSFDSLNKALSAKDISFITATDGNHGRGVAWTANRLGYKAVVFMPEGSAEDRISNIRREGAEVIVTDKNYDDTVQLAQEYAKVSGGIIVQDTAWEGYEEIPLWIMQGYATIIDEALEQVQSKPTHIFLQAGVGSFAASIQASLIVRFGDEAPKVIIVEPHNANCIYKSAQYNTEKAQTVSGSLSTIMAGLSCGTPNPIAWKILRRYSTAFVSCPDYFAARGMRILASPTGDDQAVISGESAAVGPGLLSLIIDHQEYGDILDNLGINSDSKILFISTEGDTDPLMYKKIVWDGLYPVL